jgi:hypothetical protein
MAPTAIEIVLRGQPERPVERGLFGSSTICATVAPTAVVGRLIQRSALTIRLSIATVAITRISLDRDRA